MHDGFLIRFEEESSFVNVVSEGSLSNDFDRLVLVKARINFFLARKVRKETGRMNGKLQSWVLEENKTRIIIEAIEPKDGFYYFW